MPFPVGIYDINRYIAISIPQTIPTNLYVYSPILYEWFISIVSPLALVTVLLFFFSFIPIITSKCMPKDHISFISRESARMLICSLSVISVISVIVCLVEVALINELISTFLSSTLSLVQNVEHRACGSNIQIGNEQGMDIINMAFNQCQMESLSKVMGTIYNSLQALKASFIFGGSISPIYQLQTILAALPSTVQSITQPVIASSEIAIPYSIELKNDYNFLLDEVNKLPVYFNMTSWLPTYISINDTLTNLIMSSQSVNSSVTLESESTLFIWSFIRNIMLVLTSTDNIPAVASMINGIFTIDSGSRQLQITVLDIQSQNSNYESIRTVLIGCILLIIILIQITAMIVVHRKQRIGWLLVIISILSVSVLSCLFGLSISFYLALNDICNVKKDIIYNSVVGISFDLMENVVVIVDDQMVDTALTCNDPSQYLIQGVVKAATIASMESNFTQINYSIVQKKSDLEYLTGIMLSYGNTTFVPLLNGVNDAFNEAIEEINNFKKPDVSVLTHLQSILPSVPLNITDTISTETFFRITNIDISPLTTYTDMVNTILNANYIPLLSVTEVYALTPSILSSPPYSNIPTNYFNQLSSLVILIEALHSKVTLGESQISQLGLTLSYMIIVSDNYVNEVTNLIGNVTNIINMQPSVMNNLKSIENDITQLVSIVSETNSWGASISQVANLLEDGSNVISCKLVSQYYNDMIEGHVCTILPTNLLVFGIFIVLLEVCMVVTISLSSLHHKRMEITYKRIYLQNISSAAPSPNLNEKEYLSAAAV